MKIRTKLLSLIVIMIVSTSISTGIYAGFNLYTKKIDAEKNILQLYRNSIKKSHTELFRFLLDAFEIKEQREEFENSLKEQKKIYEQVNNITLLSKIDKNVSQAIDNIKNLQDYQNGGLTKFNNATDELLKVVEDIMKSSDKFVLNTLNTSTGGFAERDISKLKFYVSKMKRELYALEIGYQTSVNIIDDQYAIIDSKIKSFERLGNTLSIILYVTILAFSFFIASLIAGKISKSIGSINKSLSIMASGDLQNEIYVKSKDELSTLSKEMNTFQDGLNDSINKIKDYSHKNEIIQDELINTVTETSSSSEEISANINSVEKQIITLNNNIFQSSNKVNQISEFTNNLNSHISDQMAMVEESTASITQMIASISSVSNLTDKNQDIMQRLQETAKEGDSQINETTDIIEEINSSVQNIGAMAEVIQNISDQTNLLAMNAAIEAAHAGDAGKGFAVVADEIRKLSEASTLSSNDISKNLKDIIKKFERASISGINTREAFGNIYGNIKDASNSLLEISSSTSELNIGGKQILEAMDNLSDISSEVHNQSVSVKASATAVRESMVEVSNISNTVTDAMAEVNIGFQEIQNSIAGLEKISNDVGYVSRDLNKEVENFKTKK
ncbi:methyl-accepting chemotaxis protein [Thiospirochaeta perfilievii]|uniref:Methyl-accepting chemotaxis protein n=1 Tax=Thiospirochaeta perfilievii TaxID=252967 RepID=A0A5C1QC85_9SPIO|nr:HAMP domain-containing methyl-accepting chemotaxis protein [Thiospirochaeta perfilievii]QEN04948.1 methyl-accepting chemotaxis protein [Thiospirochaeta perfilievii]